MRAIKVNAAMRANHTRPSHLPFTIHQTRKSSYIMYAGMINLNDGLLFFLSVRMHEFIKEFCLIFHLL